MIITHDSQLAWGNPVMTILCDHMLIVCVSSKFFLYAIPPLQPVSECGTTPPIYVKPLGMYDDDIEWQENTLIWNMLCSHHEGRQSVAGGFKGCMLVVLPETGQSENTFVRQSMRQGDMGPR